MPLPPVVTMVMTLHCLATCVSRIDHAHLNTTDHTPNVIHTESMAAIGVCNQLAVAVLGVLKVSETGKMLSSQVQTYAQQMAQAGKSLNQLLKNGLLTIDSDPEI